MRTTIRLDDDVAAAAQRVSHEEHIGLGEAVNTCSRRVASGTPKAAILPAAHR